MKGPHGCGPGFRFPQFTFTIGLICGSGEVGPCAGAVSDNANDRMSNSICDLLLKNLIDVFRHNSTYPGQTAFPGTSA